MFPLQVGTPRSVGRAEARYHRVGASGERDSTSASVHSKFPPRRCDGAWRRGRRLYFAVAGAWCAGGGPASGERARLASSRTASICSPDVQSSSGRLGSDLFEDVGTVGCCPIPPPSRRSARKSPPSSASVGREAFRRRSSTRPPNGGSLGSWFEEDRGKRRNLDGERDYHVHPSIGRTHMAAAPSAFAWVPSGACRAVGRHSLSSVVRRALRLCLLFGVEAHARRAKRRQSF